MARDLHPVHITRNKRNMWADRERESILKEILALAKFYF